MHFGKLKLLQGELEDVSAANGAGLHLDIDLNALGIPAIPQNLTPMLTIYDMLAERKHDSQEWLLSDHRRPGACCRLQIVTHRMKEGQAKLLNL